MGPDEQSGEDGRASVQSADSVSSEVPEDCIMRCMERNVCLSTAVRATESFPSEDVS